ncbi:predicted protein [Uncinocarpus reesii 1704]|uniref:Uncharacterized protein n=1 Tax=Uncinocarpus reesii (strain UAMH 1704) TaxID=336963 RepID=C4JPE5_UNCRE|nr:uncharacterized protein UREG_04527 [Uncinocarpus reesii 1704]EEP79681.1 predicted protein [Uncinocarpus reesii 1704]
MVEPGIESRRKSTSSRLNDVEKSSDTFDVEIAVANVEDKFVNEAEAPRDPNIVDWDGPDDPQNPLNWTLRKKATIVSSIAVITFITYGFALDHLRISRKVSAI